MLLLVFIYPIRLWAGILPFPYLAWVSFASVLMWVLNHWQGI